MEYDERLVRQVLECVVVASKEKIKVIFAGGLEVEQTIIMLESNTLKKNDLFFP